MKPVQEKLLMVFLVEESSRHIFMFLNTWYGKIYPTKVLHYISTTNVAHSKDMSINTMICYRPTMAICKQSQNMSGAKVTIALMESRRVVPILGCRRPVVLPAKCVGSVD